MRLFCFGIPDILGDCFRGSPWKWVVGGSLFLISGLMVWSQAVLTHINLVSPKSCSTVIHLHWTSDIPLGRNKCWKRGHQSCPYTGKRPSLRWSVLKLLSGCCESFMGAFILSLAFMSLQACGFNIRYMFLKLCSESSLQCWIRLPSGYCSQLFSIGALNQLVEIWEIQWGKW